MQLSRQDLANLYRPAGPKLINTVAFVAGGQGAIAQGIDLSLPIRGFRFVFTGRVVVGTAAFTNVNPEGLLNLISGINIFGTNARQKGNVTLWNMDLASLFVLKHLFGYRTDLFTINSGAGDALVPVPTTPFPAAGATGYFNGATGTYDFRITVDVPFHPFRVNGYGAQPEIVPAFLVRNEEWKDSMQIQFTFGNQLGNAEGALGLAAATTTVVFSAYGSGAGSPSISVYSLPVLTGTKLNSAILPGVISRVQTPLAAVLQAAGNQSTLVNMQKQPTSRVILKTGTALVAPFFKTLSDTNVTALGIQLGGNRNVRNLLDVWTHKQQHADVYGRDPVQGYAVQDFVESGNPDSAYPGQDIGDGSSFQLQANITGVANAQGIAIQEMILHQHQGALYNG